MNNLPDDIKIIRSARRKKVVLRINRNGDYELLLPSTYPESAALALIQQNPEIISRLRERAKKVCSPRPTFSNDAKLFFLGKTYPLFTSQRLKQFDGERFMVPAGKEAERLETLENIYKSLAKKHILPRVAEFAAKFHLSIGTVKITSAVTRWGSCSADGNLNFSWYLIRCPQELIDSVICHELAHRLVLNHSPHFYRQLRKFDPLYAEHRTALKHFTRENPWFR